MPAIDICEPPIIRALQKAGWHVLNRQVPIEFYPDRFVFADLRMANADREIIVVEVKCFADSDRQLDELYRAVGQYQLYRSALRLMEFDLSVFLAVPLAAHEDFLQIEVVRIMLANAGVKLIVVDVELEEVRLWQV